MNYHPWQSRHRIRFWHYDKIQTLSNTLVNAHEQLKDKNNKIKTLTDNNEALNLTQVDDYKVGTYIIYDDVELDCKLYNLSEYFPDFWHYSL